MMNKNMKFVMKSSVVAGALLLGVCLGGNVSEASVGLGYAGATQMESKLDVEGRATLNAPVKAAEAQFEGQLNSQINTQSTKEMTGELQATSTGVLETIAGVSSNSTARLSSHADVDLDSNTGLDSDVDLDSNVALDSNVSLSSNVDQIDTSVQVDPNVETAVKAEAHVNIDSSPEPKVSIGADSEANVENKAAIGANAHTDTKLRSDFHLNSKQNDTVPLDVTGPAANGTTAQSEINLKACSKVELKAHNEHENSSADMKGHVRAHLNAGNAGNTGNEAVIASKVQVNAKGKADVEAGFQKEASLVDTIQDKIFSSTRLATDQDVDIDARAKGTMKEATKSKLGAMFQLAGTGDFHASALADLHTEPEVLHTEQIKLHTKSTVYVKADAGAQVQEAQK